MTDETAPSIQDVARRMALARAELMTAKASKDQDVINASLFQILEEVIVGMQSITAELLKVEIEGLDKASF